MTRRLRATGQRQNVSQPTSDELLRLCEQIGLTLDAEQVESALTLLAPLIDCYNVIDRMPDNLPGVTYPRTPGFRPDPTDNPHNAWYVKTAIRGAQSGKLRGKRVVLKDNIMLAGVPMMNGSATLEGYIPPVDATVVTRVLDAGAEIIGKAHCEGFCFSDSSHTNATGHVHNPLRHGYSAGGSSSGCAVLVAAGEADMAIGGDQGGSIRTPASFCGIYGMKPTFGLVPYTGIMPIEIVVDHAGPMTGSVTDNATLLEVLAGPDGFDMRQAGQPGDRYLEGIDLGVEGMRIAILREGFGHEHSEADVDEAVRAAVAHLERLGARVSEVSIPMHRLGEVLWVPIGIEGMARTMMWGDGFGVSRQDLYVTDLMDFHRDWRNRADELPETVKLYLLLGTYIGQQHGGRYYGKAMNLRRALAAAYDDVLRDVDLIAMPTTPMKARPLPDMSSSWEVASAHTRAMSSNTAPFNLAHHPAMSLPCGVSDGLPIGMMLVGRHFEESTIYRAAFALERSLD